MIISPFGGEGTQVNLITLGGSACATSPQASLGRYPEALEFDPLGTGSPLFRLEAGSGDPQHLPV